MTIYDLRVEPQTLNAPREIAGRFYFGNAKFCSLSAYVATTLLLFHFKNSIGKAVY